MEAIKIARLSKFIWGNLFCCLFVQCKSEPEIFKISLKRSPHINSENNVEYYMVNNPPRDTAELLALINKNLDTTLLNQKKYKVYGQIYYKECFFFNRNYKPHYKWYNNYIHDDIRNGESHLEDEYVTVYAKNEKDTSSVRPNYPFYVFHDENLIYYPNGFKNNPHKHWRNIRD